MNHDRSEDAAIGRQDLLPVLHHDATRRSFPRDGLSIEIDSSFDCVRVFIVKMRLWQIGYPWRNMLKLPRLERRSLTTDTSTPSPRRIHRSVRHEHAVWGSVGAGMEFGFAPEYESNLFPAELTLATEAIRDYRTRIDRGPLVRACPAEISRAGSRNARTGGFRLRPAE